MNPVGHMSPISFPPPSVERKLDGADGGLICSIQSPSEPHWKLVACVLARIGSMGRNRHVVLMRVSGIQIIRHRIGRTIEVCYFSMLNMKRRFPTIYGLIRIV